MKFQESRVPELYKIGLRSVGLNWDEPDTINMFDIAYTSLAKFLGDAKSKEEKVAVVLEDLKGEFRLGAIVEYHLSENDEAGEAGKGNWTLAYTLDPKDIEGCKVYKANDNYVQRFVADVAHSKYGYLFTGGYQHIQVLLIKTVDAMKEWLDKNVASEDPELEIENLITATVSIEGDVKYYGITAAESLKQYVKNDAGEAV